MVKPLMRSVQPVIRLERPTAAVGKAGKICWLAAGLGEEQMRVMARLCKATIRRK